MMLDHGWRAAAGGLTLRKACEQCAQPFTRVLSPGADERAFRFCFRCRKAAEDSAGEDTVAETTTPSELGFLTNVSALPPSS